MIPYGRRLTGLLTLLLALILAGGTGLAYWQGGAQARAAGPVPGTPDEQDGVIPHGTSPTMGPSGAVVPELSPSAGAAPHSREVSDLVARYFTAINRLDYDAWLTTVTTAQSQRDRDSWEHDYSTTTDYDVYISDIAEGDPITVRMQFTSNQDIEFAPDDMPEQCIRWDVTYQVVDEGVGLRIGTSAQQSVTAPC